MFSLTSHTHNTGKFLTFSPIPHTHNTDKFPIISPTHIHITDKCSKNNSQKLDKCHQPSAIVLPKDHPMLPVDIVNVYTIKDNK